MARCTQLFLILTHFGEDKQTIKCDGQQLNAIVYLALLLYYDNNMIYCSRRLSSHLAVVNDFYEELYMKNR